MKTAVLTTEGQWFVPYAKLLAEELKADLFFSHKVISEKYDALFILGYHRLIDPETLKRNQFNLVIHESALPRGKGWAPLFWQVIEGKNDITFTMFEAAKGVDDGDIYLQEVLHLDGSELNEELRHKQAMVTMHMCRRFIDEHDSITPAPQHGLESFYPKRSAEDSKLDVDKSLKEQFNLLRTVHNKDYPAFFELNGTKYKLAIEKLKKDRE